MWLSISAFLLLSNYFHRRSPSLTALFGKTVENIVPDDVGKCRLDSYLSKIYEEHSRSFIGGLCDDGLVKVNDIPQMKSYKVVSGDRIVFEVEEMKESQVTPENIPLDILYEDDYIIAINKPNNMVVHPAVGSPNGTFVNALLYHLGDQAENLLHYDTIANIDPDNEDLPETPEAANASPQYLRPGIVHRLDKGTTGVLIAGKTTEAVSKLSELFAKREIKKTYLTVCVGHPGETTIIDPIGRSQKNRQLMTVYAGPPGKPARSHVKTIAFDGKLSLALVRIETGRTHQIRVHLKERRTPILGDSSYGNSEWNKKFTRSDSIQRPLLHAYELQFIHPFTKKEIILKAPIPNDMFKIMEKISAPSTATFTNYQATGGEGKIYDENSKLLTCSTEVKGINILDFAEKKGFVPFDRVLMEEDDWTSVELPEDPAFFQ